MYHFFVMDLLMKKNIELVNVFMY